MSGVLTMEEPRGLCYITSLGWVFFVFVYWGEVLQDDVI